MNLRQKPQVTFNEKKIEYNEKDVKYREKDDSHRLDKQHKDVNDPLEDNNKKKILSDNKKPDDNSTDSITTIHDTVHRSEETQDTPRIIHNSPMQKKKNMGILYSSASGKKNKSFSQKGNSVGRTMERFYKSSVSAASTTIQSSHSLLTDSTKDNQQASNYSQRPMSIVTSSASKIYTGVSRIVKTNRKSTKKNNTIEQADHRTDSRKDKKAANKSDNTAYNLVKEAGKAIKRLIALILSVSSPLAVCVILLSILLIVAVSVFGIFFSNDDNSLTDSMNEIVAEYHEKIENIKGKYDYDTLSVEGSSPDWKEIILGYCGRYSSAAAGSEQEVFAVFTEASKVKLKTVFWDMVSISENTEVTKEESIGSDGKKTTITRTKLIITIDTLTALEYAEEKGFTEEQIANINLLSQVSDELWNNLLGNVDSFSLTGGFVGDWVYYDQTQYSNSYGDDTIAGSGCGPTSFAMVATYLTASSITPVDAIWCGNSYYVYNVGTSWSYFSAAADHFGFRMEGQTSAWSTVIDALRNGKPVISAQRAGIFTRGGHFIVLAGLDSNENIIVYDPNGGNGYNPDGKGAVFTQSQVSASGTQYWIFDSDLNQGGNVAELAWRYLRNAGLSKEAAAGVIGNMMTECGGHTLNLDPTLYDGFTGTHYGLCQWDIHYFPDITKKGARAQLEYLCNDFMGAEIQTFGFLYKSGFTLDEFKNMKNVENAAVAFAVVCERPGYEYNNYQLRRQDAMTAYNYFKNK